MPSCGDCRFFRAHTETPAGWLGDCRHQPQRGDFGPDAPICMSFLSRSAPIPSALPAAPTRHRSRTLHGRVDPIVRRHTPAPPPTTGATTTTASSSSSSSSPDTDLTELGELFDMNAHDLKNLLREALEDTPVPLAPRWEGGTLVLKPADPALQARELPIDQLFHKVVMVRDRLRVLEQKINSNAKLTDAEKVDMQQYVTRCYGSLTTFNQLFRDKADHFVGDRGGEKSED